jgi:hypothetical protein
VAVVQPGQAITFTATVNGAADPTVRWMVADAGGGSIDSQGRYTAPATPGTHNVGAFEYR